MRKSLTLHLNDIVAIVIHIFWQELLIIVGTGSGNIHCVHEKKRPVAFSS